MEKLHSLSVAPVERPLAKSDEDYERTLQIHWFGASCYVIRLGDSAILVDPYLSYQTIGQVLFSHITSDPSKVREAFGQLPIPRAIFLSHMHFDHALDIAAAHRQRGWQNVRIYGSYTAYNILRGYGSDVANSWQETQDDGTWHECGAGTHVRYQAFRADHAPQLPGIRLYTGQVSIPRTSVPVRAVDFKCGDIFAYLFELRNWRTRYRIYMTAAPTSPPLALPSVPVGTIDVAIFCVADWRFARNYPDGCIARLHPRQVIASHFDDFLLLSGRKRAVIPYANLDAFMRHVETITSYPEFQAIRIPDVDSVLLVHKGGGPQMPDR